jgi:uncharacterized protein
VGTSGGEQLRFRVTQLGRSVGNTESHRVTSTAFSGTGLADAVVSDAVVADDPAEVSLTLESTEDGIEARGEVHLHWEGQCRRCLEPAFGEANAAFSELFTQTIPAEVVPDDASTETLIRNGWIDLVPALRDTVLLALPLAPLCSDDCPGPSPGSFPVSVDDPDAEDADGGAPGKEAPGDPRWAALSSLRFDPEPD